MNRLDAQYLDLLEVVLRHGDDKPDRTGVGTISIFDYTITHCMCDGFPLLTTKKMAVKTMMTELKWFLRVIQISDLFYLIIVTYGLATPTKGTRTHTIMI